MDRPVRGETIRFLVVDDHSLIRRGILASLKQHENWHVADAVGTLAEGLLAIRAHHIDVAIIDLGLPDGSGLEFIEQALEIAPNLKIVVSSMRDELVFAPRCIAQGAMGYVAKQTSDERLTLAIESVIDGEIYLSESVRALRNGAPIVRTDPASVGSLPPRFESLARLSNRELSVFELVGMGFTTKEIADRLSVKTKTIDSFRERIKNKLELGSSSELLQFATRWTVAVEEGS
ncbi:MAG: response regulator transcription factor [Planctomycetota bacterium]